MKGVSIASLVVPSIFETITLSWFNTALAKLDFPSLGLPIKQNFISPCSSSSSFSGRFSIIASNKSPIPIPCEPLIAIGSPIPRL